MKVVSTMDTHQEPTRFVYRLAWAKYGVAVVLTGSTLLIRVLIGNRIDVPNLIILVIPIILTAYWGGLKPGLLATALATVGAMYFVLQPIHSFYVGSPTHRIQLVFLALTGVLISAICERFHRQQDRMESLLRERRHHEAELAHMAAIVESSDDAIVSKTLDGIVTSWNTAAERLFGYSAEEMIGRGIILLIPSDRLDEEVKILSSVRRGESMQHLDTVRVRKDGSFIDVSITTSAIKDSSGKIIGASKVARDITDRKKAERALRDSEQRTRMATEATAVGIWEWDLASNQVRWDAQMFRIYGTPQTPDGIVDYTVWREAVLPEELTTQETTLQETIRSLGKSSRLFSIKRYDDHSIRFIEAVETVRTNAQGQAEWLVGTNLDVTARRQMEWAVRDSEARFRTMANSISQLAWIAQPDGDITWYNQRWYDYTGTTPEQMQGSGWQNVHDESRLPEVLKVWTNAIATGSVFEMEFPLRGADGKFRTFLTRGQPVKDETGQVVQWFGTNTDVETFKRAEADVQQQNAELEQRVVRRTAQLEAANKELEAFSYSVSHDLRAPLRALDGYSLALVDDFGSHLPGEAQRLLQVIRKSAQQMGNLIDDLLSFARLSRLPLSKYVVNMTALVQDTLQMQQAEHAGRQVTINVGDLPSCYGDATVLKQVWTNLVSNAIKYTGKCEHAVIDVGVTNQFGDIAYFVRDNGTGFDMRYADKLFGVFQRLHRAEDYEGTGVGLAIVQRIVHRHGGRIWAESIEGQGATFYFTVQMEANS